MSTRLQSVLLHHQPFRHCRGPPKLKLY